MTRFRLGQQFIDHKRRVFTITDMYSATEVWKEDQMYCTWEVQEGNIHIQGKRETADLLKIGFVDQEETHTILSITDARDFEKRGLLKFE